MELEISYSQVSVFDPALEAPFNDWTEAHVAQGFAWRPGSVSFGTLEAAGTLIVEVTDEPYDSRSSDAARVIAVPFHVPKSDKVEVASIGSSAVVELRSREYELVFEHGVRNGQMWAKIHFIPAFAKVDARIVKADEALSPPEQLVMTAKPAT